MEDEHIHDAWKKLRDQDKEKSEEEEEMEDLEEGFDDKKIPHSKHKRVKPKLLDEEVTINFKIKPMQILKWLGVVVVIILIFLLGRLSVGCGCDVVTSDTSSVEEVKVAETTEDNSMVDSVSGFFSGLFSSSGTEASPTGGSTVENNTSDDSVKEVSTETEDSTDTDETKEVEETSESKEEVAEDIITSYSSVSLAISDIVFDWKGTWGKMEKIKYTIQNNEIGTIKPDHFVMLVAGYDDAEKTIPLAKSSKTVKSKTSVSSTATIPGGFSYSGVTAGDLSNVVVTLILYDSNDKEIATLKKGFNLQG